MEGPVVRDLYSKSTGGRELGGRSSDPDCCYGVSGWLSGRSHLLPALTRAKCRLLQVDGRVTGATFLVDFRCLYNLPEKG